MCDKSKKDKIEAQAVIQYLQKKDITSKEIHEDMVQILSEDSLSSVTVKKWAIEFEQDKDHIEIDSWSGCPKTSTTDEYVDGIFLMVLEDRHLTPQQIAKAIGISFASVYTLLTEILGMSKLSVTWVPRMPIPEQKLKRLTFLGHV